MVAAIKRQPGSVLLGDGKGSEMAVGKCCGTPVNCKRNCELANYYAGATGPVKEDPFDNRFCCFHPLTCKKLSCSLVMAYEAGRVEHYAEATVSWDYSDIKPSYYNSGSNDLIAFALAHGIGAMEFTVMKYVMRWKGKDGLKDLRKAREYLDRLIAHEDARLAGELASEAEDVASKGDT